MKQAIVSPILLHRKLGSSYEASWDCSLPPPPSTHTWPVPFLSAPVPWKTISIALVIFYILVYVCKTSSVNPSSYHGRKCGTTQKKISCCQLVKHMQTTFYSSCPPPAEYLHSLKASFLYLFLPIRLCIYAPTVYWALC